MTISAVVEVARITACGRVDKRTLTDFNRSTKTQADRVHKLSDLP